MLILSSGRLWPRGKVEEEREEEEKGREETFPPFVSHSFQYPLILGRGQ